MSKMNLFINESFYWHRRVVFSFVVSVVWGVEGSYLAVYDYHLNRPRQHPTPHSYAKCQNERGAENKMQFYEDAVKRLDRTITPNTIASSTTDAQGAPQFVVETNSGLRPVEQAIRRALASVLSSQRRNGEGFDALLGRMMSDSNQQTLLLDAVKKALPVQLPPEIADKVAEAYVGNLVGQPDGGNVNMLQVLQQFAEPDRDEAGAPVPTIAEVLRANGLLLGVPIAVSKVVLRTDSENIANKLAGFPEVVLPPKDGDTKETWNRFKRIGELLSQAPSEDRNCHLRREVAKAISAGGEEPSVNDPDSFLNFKGDKGNVIFALCIERPCTEQFIEDIANLVGAVQDRNAKLKDYLWLAHAYSRAQGSIFNYNRYQLWASVFNTSKKGHRRNEKCQIVWDANNSNLGASGLRNAARNALQQYGFISGDGTFNMQRGLQFLANTRPDEAQNSALFATLVGGNGDLSADAFLAYEQKRRLKSVYRKPEPVEQRDLTPEEAAAKQHSVELQTAARRAIQVYGNSSIPKEVWDYCLRESCDDVKAANMMYGGVSSHYVQRQQRYGPVAASQFLKDFMSKKYRYFPVIDPATGKVQVGVVNRSDTPMSDEEYAAQIEAINESRRGQRYPAIERSVFDQSDSRGPKIWGRMTKVERLLVRPMAVDRMWFPPFSKDKKTALLNLRLWECALAMSSGKPRVAVKMFSDFVGRYAQIKKHGGESVANDWLSKVLKSGKASRE